MKTWTNPGSLVAMLVAILAVAGCDGAVTEATQSSDLAAAAEVAEKWAAAYSAHVGSERPARVVLGSWTHISEFGEEWSDRLAAGMEEYARRGLAQFPDAPRLLTSSPSREALLSCLPPSWTGEDVWTCCPIFGVRVQLNEGEWEIRELGEVGDLAPAFPETRFEWVIGREARWR